MEGPVGLSSEEKFKGKKWEEFVETMYQAWYDFYEGWLNNNPSENLLVVQYVDLLQNLKWVWI